jgi:lipopolysaccharide transport system permease protein
MLSPWHIGATLWRHRELVWQFTLREIHIRHKGSRLGIVWALINPLSMLALYWFVFGAIFGSKFGVLKNESQLDYALALFLSLSLYHVFSETIAWAPSLIASNPNFVKKVVFPLEVLPVAKLGDTAFHLVVSLTLVLLGSAFGSTGLTADVLWLPVLVFPLMMLALGIAWMLTAIGVFLRDIGQATGFVSSAVMFASAGMERKTPPAAWSNCSKGYIMITSGNAAGADASPTMQSVANRKIATSCIIDGSVRQRPAPRNSRTTRTTWSCCASVISGKIGNDRIVD